MSSSCNCFVCISLTTALQVLCTLSSNTTSPVTVTVFMEFVDSSAGHMRSALLASVGRVEVAVLRVAQLKAPLPLSWKLLWILADPMLAQRTPWSQGRRLGLGELTFDLPFCSSCSPSGQAVWRDPGGLQSFCQGRMGFKTWLRFLGFRQT